MTWKGLANDLEECWGVKETSPGDRERAGFGLRTVDGIAKGVVVMPVRQQ